MSKRDSVCRRWTVEDLRKHVRMKHHQALTRYLFVRTDGQASDAESVGLTADRIVREGFDVKNGDKNVPDCALRLYQQKKISAASAVAVVSASRYNAPAKLRLADLLLEREGRESLGQEALDLVNLIDVAKVMES